MHQHSFKLKLYFMDMNVLLSITKSLFTDFRNTVEAPILLEKEKTMVIFISYIYRRAPGTR